jgi:hypothetical protein
MRRTWNGLLACLLLSAAACGGEPPTNALGEVPAEACDNKHLDFVTTTVVDSAGAPVAGATVVGTHLQSGLTQTGTTGASGVSKAITEDVGAGRVAVQAYRGSQPSDVVEVEFVCGDCGCTPQPQAVTVRL